MDVNKENSQKLDDLQDKLNKQSEDAIENHKLIKNTMAKNLVMINFVFLPADGNSGYELTIMSPVGKWMTKIFRIKNDWKKLIMKMLDEEGIKYKSVEFVSYN
jgi:hypothetical protein